MNKSHKKTLKVNKNKSKDMTTNNVWTIDKFEKQKWMLSFIISAFICLNYFNENLLKANLTIIKTFFTFLYPIVTCLFTYAIQKKFWKNKLILNNINKLFKFIHFISLILSINIIIASTGIVLILYLTLENLRYFVLLDKYISFSIISDIIIGFSLFINTFLPLLLFIKMATKKYRIIFNR